MHLILYQVDIRTRSNSNIRMICLFIEYTETIFILLLLFVCVKSENKTEYLR